MEHVSLSSGGAPSFVVNGSDAGISGGSMVAHADGGDMSRQARILCASCGAVIAPNPANLCINCIRNDVDITEGIPKQATLHFCRGCDRYLQPPNA
ncbi:ribosome-binding protein, partial [Cladochytrium tenue]